MKNFRDAAERQYRISHDALFNLYQLCYQLKFKSRKGEDEDFISFMCIHPRIIVRLCATPLLRSLNMLIKVSTAPPTLHYDTLFNVGDYYLSTLCFRHGLFLGDPIVPVAFFIHSRRYRSDHIDFLSSITAAASSLLSRQVNVVTDREFEFGSVFPIGNQLFCWIHLENDLLWYLKKNCNATAEELSYYINTWKDLVLNESEVEFDRELERLWSSDRFVSNQKICGYFRDNLIPAFKAHAAIWTLKAAGVADFVTGITNNPSESMNAVLRRLKNWKQVPLDVITVSLYHLSMYYYREIERSFHQCGKWVVKDEFEHLKREPSLLPFFPKVYSPKEIVDKVALDIREVQLLQSVPEECESDADDFLPGKELNTQNGLAHSAIQDNRVKLVKSGAWVVIESDGVTPRAVTLFPKETCSCPSPMTCYHITACRLMVGLTPQLSGKCNLTEMRRRNRQTKERPSGRKRPRKDDFEGSQQKAKKTQTKCT